MGHFREALAIFAKNYWYRYFLLWFTPQWLRGSMFPYWFCFHFSIAIYVTRAPVSSISKKQAAWRIYQIVAGSIYNMGTAQLLIFTSGRETFLYQHLTPFTVTLGLQILKHEVENCKKCRQWDKLWMCHSEQQQFAEKKKIILWLFRRLVALIATGRVFTFGVASLLLTSELLHSV